MAHSSSWNTPPSSCNSNNSPAGSYKSTQGGSSFGNSFNSPGTSYYSPGNKYGSNGSPINAPGGSFRSQGSYSCPSSSSPQQHCRGNHRGGTFGCSFCYQNKEIRAVYLSHSLKDGYGKVTCPVLSSNVCPYCKATGPDAHTKAYCPLNQKPSFKNYLEYRNASGGKYEKRSPGNMGKY